MTTEPNAPSLRRPCLAFVVTEDWFFVSHFLPMARAARNAGFDPVVITRVREHAAAIEAAGARVVPLEANRRSLNPMSALSFVRRLAGILKRERAEVVHCIALRSIVLGGLAARLARIDARVFAVTGGGFLSARTDRGGRAAAGGVIRFIRSALQSPGTRYLFENDDDPRAFGLDPVAANVLIVGGAGVDPDHFRPAPAPEGDVLRVAMVSRMLWSKGADLAVAAVSQARGHGAKVELSLFGAPDPANPKAIAQATLEDWATRPGIAWRGVSRDVREVWRDHHLACLPSRGGEGLPRTLLEAAACGRAMLTTDVPGCRSFVRDATDGYVVPAEDAHALAERLVALANDRERVAWMGTNARERVLAGYTEAAVSGAVERLYRSLRAA